MKDIKLPTLDNKIEDSLAEFSIETTYREIIQDKIIAARYDPIDFIETITVDGEKGEFDVQTPKKLEDISERKTHAFFPSL